VNGFTINIMKHKKKNIIGIVASPGGHLTQLLQVSKAWSNYSAFYVSTHMSAIPLFKKMGKFYIIEESGRGRLFGTLKSIFTCLVIVNKERPKVIISGGSGCGTFLCLFGKLFGSKTIWLDSVANVEDISLSGRVILPFIDLFIVQWEHLTKRYKKVEYYGKVI
jgi:hypothetical protein